MARIARVLCPRIPHHVTQIGNRWQPTFFCDDDYLAYVKLMAEWCRKQGVVIWAWCLMPNHVHLITVPQTETGLARAIGEAHRRYTRRINFRENWREHLWQERFASFPMDESHLFAAIRYVEMNPVAAGLVSTPAEYRWSSARAHIEELKILKRHEHTGRPLGSERFIDKMEQAMGRVLRPQNPVPKRDLIVRYTVPYFVWWIRFCG